MGLVDDVGPGPVGLDAVAFIYFIEQHPTFLPLLRPLFMEADHGRILVTSALTLHETLVVPIRLGNAPLADQYEAVLTEARGIRLIDISRDQLRAAARLRAATKVKTPDALHLAAAMSAGCRCFVTNDRRLPNIPGLNVIQLSSYA
jgi:predicted nucleic acid-binding protein